MKHVAETRETLNLPSTLPRVWGLGMLDLERPRLFNSGVYTTCTSVYDRVWGLGFRVWGLGFGV